MSESKQSDLEQLCINTIRIVAAEAVQKANSGHPGAPMGCAPMAQALWGTVMNYSSSNPDWMNRDRFVLSNGHACALLYTMLHLTGYNVSMDNLKSFRQLESNTPGHPENFMTEGVEVTTGPLGQGICNAVGLAIGQSHLAAQFNVGEFSILDNYTYVICGDGCLQEGVSGEASSLAGHLQLGNLIVLYDDNQITIDGATDLSFTEDVAKRYEAYGWQVLTVDDGNSDCAAILSAIAAAKAETGKPTLIKVRTVIGKGSMKEGSHKTHGAPLGEEDIAGVKAKFGFPADESFWVPEGVRGFWAERKAAGDQAFAEWTARYEAYAAAHPQLANELRRRFAGELPIGWREALPTYTPDSKTEASRAYSGHVLNCLAEVMPELVGGSADLTPSNNTWLKCSHDYQAASRDGRYLRFGVREHAMAAVCNGLCAYGGTRPFCATFLTFLGYALGAVRLSALSRFPVLYIFTHDSICLGEDGPTHQPVETLMQARALPNFLVIRPADGNETSGAYAVAMTHSHTPTLLALSRQGLPNLAGSSIDAVARGAYVLQEAASDLRVILIATGSEVSLCVKAAALLEAQGCGARVVSFPCWALWEQQQQEYWQQVLPPGVPVLSVEAGVTQGWGRYAHAHVGMSSFGASGPGGKVYAHFGFTPEAVAEKAGRLRAWYDAAGTPAHALMSNPLL